MSLLSGVQQVVPVNGLDEAERFVADRMQRLRLRLGRRYERLMQRRDPAGGKHGAELIVREALRLHPLRDKADCEWWMIVWNVDRVTVQFLLLPTV